MLWQELQVLFDLIDTGHRRYGVPAYNGGLFDNARHQFLTDKVVPDWWLARVIDQFKSCEGHSASRARVVSRRLS